MHWPCGKKPLPMSSMTSQQFKCVEHTTMRKPSASRHTVDSANDALVPPKPNELVNALARVGSFSAAPRTRPGNRGSGSRRFSVGGATPCRRANTAHITSPRQPVWLVDWLYRRAQGFPQISLSACLSSSKSPIHCFVKCTHARRASRTFQSLTSPVKMASTAPAAPSRCPVAPLVEDTSTGLLRVELEASPNTAAIARCSTSSPAQTKRCQFLQTVRLFKAPEQRVMHVHEPIGVDVACALMYSTTSGRSPPVSRARRMAAIAPRPSAGGCVMW